MNHPCKCSCKDSVKRRDFIELGVKAATTVALSSPLFPILSACGQNSLPSGTPATGSSTATGTGTTDSAGSHVVFSFADHPELQTVGGSILVTLSTSSGDRDVFVTRVSDTVATTLTNLCTHEGCPLDNYDATAKTFFCNCHRSVFNSDGSVAKGPARKALTSFVSEITSTGISVTPG